MLKLLGYLFGFLLGIIFVVLIAGALILIPPKPAHSEPVTYTSTIQCNKYEFLNKTLVQEYGENIILIGVSSDNQSLLHFFGNINTGTWSFVIKTVNGVGCILFAGDGLSPYFTKEKISSQIH